VITRNAFLKGERIYLRPVELDDCKGPYLSWFNDEEVCRGNAHHIFPYTSEDLMNYISTSNKQRNDSLILAIISKKDDTHIGNIALQGIHPVYRAAELSIIIGDKTFWGKGYAKEAVSLLISHAFFSLNLRRISCGTYDTNISMQNLAKSLGMIEEGRRRQAEYKDGKYLDVFEYGLLKDEWVKNHSST
jgi:RimJ/RimL family protein N-acetyltransferase